MKIEMGLLLIALFITISGAADTTTTILQNGANGYVGCQDTWIMSGNPFPNGSDAALQLVDEWCET